MELQDLWDALLIPLQAVIDLGLVGAYLIDRMIALASLLFAPFWFIFTFIIHLVDAVSATYATTTITGFSNLTNVVAVLNEIPGFPAFVVLLGAGMWIVSIRSILKASKT